MINLDDGISEIAEPLFDKRRSNALTSAKKVNPSKTNTQRKTRRTGILAIKEIMIITLNNFVRTLTSK
jgi:hypothetical protein